MSTPGPNDTTAVGAPLAALSDGLAAAAERGGRAVVAIHARSRIPSSGVHWRPGVVVTADHTIRRDEGITVTLGDGRTVSATLAGRDPGTDLAVLRLDGADDAPIAERTEGEREGPAPRVGTLVLALGRPGPEITATFGVVSAIIEDWRTWRGGRIERVARLDLAVHDGFSGGALVDVRGRLLGIDTSGLARGAPVALPAAVVERVAAALLERGHVARGHIGVAVQAVRLPPPLAERHGLASAIGLIVVGLEPGAPAERAGVLLGDVLVEAGGEPLRDPSDLMAQLDAGQVGRSLPLTVLRAAEKRSVDVVVGERARAGGRRGGAERARSGR